MTSGVEGLDTLARPPMNLAASLQECCAHRFVSVKDQYSECSAHGTSLQHFDDTIPGGVQVNRLKIRNRFTPAPDYAASTSSTEAKCGVCHVSKKFSLFRVPCVDVDFRHGLHVGFHRLPPERDRSRLSRGR